MEATFPFELPFLYSPVVHDSNQNSMMGIDMNYVCSTGNQLFTEAEIQYEKNCDMPCHTLPGLSNQHLLSTSESYTCFHVLAIF